MDRFYRAAGALCGVRVVYPHQLKAKIREDFCVAPIRSFATGDLSWDDVKLPKSTQHSVSPKFDRGNRRFRRRVEIRRIAQVRDPRDMLVSHFYSLAYTHPLPDEPERRRDYLNMRAQLQETGIDRFALEHADYVASEFRHLRELQRGGAKLLRYSEMVTDFPAWAAKAVAPLGAQSAHVAALVERFGHEFSPKKETLEHKRVMIPGDHEVKLARETVARLDEIFEKPLDTYEF